MYNAKLSEYGRGFVYLPDETKRDCAVVQRPMSRAARCLRLDGKGCCHRSDIREKCAQPFDFSRRRCSQTIRFQTKLLFAFKLEKIADTISHIECDMSEHIPKKIRRYV